MTSQKSSKKELTYRVGLKRGRIQYQNDRTEKKHHKRLTLHQETGNGSGHETGKNSSPKEPLRALTRQEAMLTSVVYRRVPFLPEAVIRGVIYALPLLTLLAIWWLTDRLVNESY